MKVVIDIDLAYEREDGVGLEDVARYALDQAAAKVPRLLRRKPGCVCTALEADDVIRDRIGNIVGTITVEV